MYNALGVDDVPTKLNTSCTPVPSRFARRMELVPVSDQNKEQLGSWMAMPKGLLAPETTTSSTSEPSSKFALWILPAAKLAQYNLLVEPEASTQS